MSHLWRCERCKKVKDLKGPHLSNKTTVRSDCWPCAKKTTFVREKAEGALMQQEDTPQAEAAKQNFFPGLFNKQPVACTTHKFTALPAASTEPVFAQKTGSAPAPAPVSIIETLDSDVWRCQHCKKVKELKGAHLKGKTTVRSDCWPCAKKTTFIRERANASPVVKKEVVPQAEVVKPNPFAAVFMKQSVGAAAPAAAPAPAGTFSEGAEVWRCEQCKKVKDLKGAHLNDITRVRSDCWPCGKKTTFVKSNLNVKEEATTAMPLTKSVVSATVLPGSIPVTPSNEAQEAAFQNILAAATAAAAAAAKSSTSATPTKILPAFHFPSVSGEGSKKNSKQKSSTCFNDIGSNTSASTSFSSSLPTTHPFLTPAVSAASIKKFQSSFASVMTAKHEDPTSTAAQTNTAASPASGCSAVASDASKSAPSSFSPSTTSPYIMESSAGTSPPFTFRPNANYNPAAAGSLAWSTATMLPGSVAAMSTNSSSKTAAAVAQRGISPSLSPAEEKLPVATTETPFGGFAWTADTQGSAGDAAVGVVDAAAAPSMWMCEHCHKVKDLTGDHLRGKTTVRSDCWPCAKKRTFVLTMPNAIAAATRLLKLGGGREGGVSGSSPSSRTPTVNFSAAAAAPNKNTTTVVSTTPAILSPFTSPLIVPPTLITPLRTSPASNATATPSKPLLWVAPTIPPGANAVEAFYLHPDAPHAVLPEPLAGNAVNVTVNKDSTAATAATPGVSWIAAAVTSAGVSEADIATYYAAMARFDQELLKSFRERLVGGVQLRAVWFDHVLYVIADEKPADGSGNGSAVMPAKQEPRDLVNAFAELGRYAALYLAVEQKLASSRFRHIGRLFCPNEFAFAAACCYANNFFTNETPDTSLVSSQSTADPSYHHRQLHHQRDQKASTTSKFKVYGPQIDPTKSITLWGRITTESPVAQLCVVSEEQRVAAAQTLYRRVSWLAAPHAMTATAIQLSVESTASDASTSDVDGVDVVFLTGTMKLEELPQAVSLAQLSQPYA